MQCQEIVLISLVSSLFGGWTQLGISEKHVHSWFTMKYVCHSTDCNPNFPPSHGIRTAESVFTMGHKSPIQFSVMFLLLHKEQEPHWGRVSRLLFFPFGVWSLEKAAVIKLSSGLLRQLMVCVLMDLRHTPPECCYLHIFGAFSLTKYLLPLE